MQQNLDAGLRLFADRMFDTVVLSQTLQAVHNVEAILREMARVARQGVVSFPELRPLASRGRAACRPHAGYAADPVPMV